VKAAERRDEENLILYRGEQAYVLLNLYPYNSGHAMVVPYLHTGDFAGLPNEVGTDVQMGQMLPRLASPRFSHLKPSGR